MRFAALCLEDRITDFDSYPFWELSQPLILSKLLFVTAARNARPPEFVYAHVLVLCLTYGILASQVILETPAAPPISCVTGIQAAKNLGRHEPSLAAQGRLGFVQALAWLPIQCCRSPL